MFDHLVGMACHADDAIALQLGWSKTTYALVTAYITGTLAWGFLAAWFLMFGTLRRAGFSRVLQRMVWWFVFVVALFQMTLIITAVQLLGTNLTTTFTSVANAL